MIIFCILGFSIIFIALIIWIFGREEDFKIGHILGSKEDKEEGFYRRLEDRHDIDTGLYEVRPAHYVWVYNPKRKGGTAANYGLSAVRGDYREPEEDNRVNTEYNAILDRPERKACRGRVFSDKGRYRAYCKRGRDLRVHRKYYLK